MRRFSWALLKNGNTRKLLIYRRLNMFQATSDPNHEPDYTVWEIGYQINFLFFMSHR